MEVDLTPTRTAAKRRLVDADNTQQELPDPKWIGSQLNTNKKSDVMDVIIVAYIRIAENLVTPTLFDCRVYRNLHLGDQIMNAIYSARAMKIQKANGYVGNMADHKDKEVTLHCEENTRKFKLTEIAEILVKAFGLFDFSKPRDGDKNHWFGIAAPLLTYLCAHKLRMDELRVEHATMPVKRSGGVESYIGTKSYGMTSAHHILLEGISFLPEKRSSMAQSLGPMTTAIMVAKNGNSVQFGQKWKDALTRDCNHVPEIQTIVNPISGKNPSETRRILRALADLIMVTTSRNAHRAFFSITMVAKYLLSKEEWDHYRTNSNGVHNISKAKITEEDKKRKSEFNFSGIGMYKCWNAMEGELFMPQTMRTEQAAQVFFHSTFGTYKEDLSILRQITTMDKWQTRRELGKFMEDFGTKKKMSSFNLFRILCNTDKFFFPFQAFAVIVWLPIAPTIYIYI